MGISVTHERGENAFRSPETLISKLWNTDEVLSFDIRNEHDC